MIVKLRLEIDDKTRRALRRRRQSEFFPELERKVAEARAVAKAERARKRGKA